MKGPVRTKKAGTVPTRLAKHQRQHRIARLLEAHAVTSQAQLVDLLAADVIDGPSSVVIQQAHNRMHAFRGLAWWLHEVNQ